MNTIKVSKTAKALFAYKHDPLFMQKNDEQSKEYKKIIRESESARMIATIYEADKLRESQGDSAPSKASKFQITHLAASTDGVGAKEYNVDYPGLKEDGSLSSIQKNVCRVSVEQEPDDDGDYLVTWKFDANDVSKNFMEGLFEKSASPKINLFLTSAKNTPAQVIELAAKITLKKKSKHRYESLWEKYCLPPNKVDEQCGFHIEESGDE